MKEFNESSEIGLLNDEPPKKYECPPIFVSGFYYETIEGDTFKRGCIFCGGNIFIPRGHSFGECQNCGAV